VDESTSLSAGEFAYVGNRGAAEDEAPKLLTAASGGVTGGGAANGGVAGGGAANGGVAGGGAANGGVAGGGGEGEEGGGGGGGAGGAVYGLANAVLDTPWPKLEVGKRQGLTLVHLSA